MKQVIAIHGKMHSGKTTAAKYIYINLVSTVRPFAKPIKDFATLLGWDGKKGKKGRRLLQLLGTEVGRECISDTIWVDKWQESLGDTGSNVTIICDDLRFQNEYEHLNKLCESGVPVTILHIQRATEHKPLLVELFEWIFADVHPSERGIKFNKELKPLVISNDATISALHDKLEWVINEYI